MFGGGQPEKKYTSKSTSGSALTQAGETPAIFNQEEKEKTMNELIKVDRAEYGLEETKAKEIEAAFVPMLEKMTELEGNYNAVVAKAAEGIDEQVCKEAKALRLQYVKVRTGTAEIHKIQKAFYLSAGRCVDGWKNAQLHASNGIEEKLSAIENHYENMERARIAKLQETRAVLLSRFDDTGIPDNLGTMSDDIWENYYAGVSESYRQRKAAEKKAEEDRIAKEKAEAEERERIRLENERLKIEAAERDKKEAAERVERERIEKERLAKEKAELAERERLEREKAEQEAKAKADAKAEAERVADKNHRSNVESGICGLLSGILDSEDLAQAVVKAIKSGSIPNLTITY